MLVNKRLEEDPEAITKATLKIDISGQPYEISRSASKGQAAQGTYEVEITRNGQPIPEEKLMKHSPVYLKTSYSFQLKASATSLLTMA